MSRKIGYIFLLFTLFVFTPAHAIEVEVWQDYPGYLKKFRFFEVPPDTDAESLKRMLDKHATGPGAAYKTYSANFYAPGKTAQDGPFGYAWRSGAQSGYRKIETLEQRKNYEQPLMLGAEFLSYIYSSEPVLAKRAFNGQEVWLGGGGMLGEEVTGFEFNGDGMMLLSFAFSKGDTLRTYSMIGANDPMIKKIEVGSRVLLEGTMRGLIGTSILIDRARLIDVRPPGQRLDQK